MVARNVRMHVWTHEGKGVSVEGRWRTPSRMPRNIFHMASMTKVSLRKVDSDICFQTLAGRFPG